MINEGRLKVKGILQHSYRADQLFCLEGQVSYGSRTEVGRT